MVLYRCRVAQSGGNWLKLAKSKWFGTKKLRKTNNAVGPIDWLDQYLRVLLYAMTRWSRGSVLASDPGIWSSNPLDSKIFFIFHMSYGGHGFKSRLNLRYFFLRGIEFSLSFMTFRYHKWINIFFALFFQAIISNFLASCPCYLGLITGILLGELKGINNYIFAVAGGMFLYIALVDMLPELNSTLEEISRKSIKSSVNVFILQNIGILTGIFSLFLFAKYQHNIEIYL